MAKITKKNWFSIPRSMNRDSQNSNVAVGIKEKGLFFAPGRRTTRISHCSAIFMTCLEQGKGPSPTCMAEQNFHNVILYLGLNSVNDWLLLAACAVFTQPRLGNRVTHWRQNSYFLPINANYTNYYWNYIGINANYSNYYSNYIGSNANYSNYYSNYSKCISIYCCNKSTLNTLYFSALSCRLSGIAVRPKRWLGWWWLLPLPTPRARGVMFQL